MLRKYDKKFFRGNKIKTNDHDRRRMPKRGQLREIKEVHEVGKKVVGTF